MTRRRPYLTLALLAALTLALGWGCSDDDDDHHHDHDGAVHSHDGGHHHHDGGEDLDKEGCAHLQSGPFVDVASSTTATGAGEVKADHKAYRVPIPAGAAGYAKYAASAKGELTLFLDQPVMVELKDDQGKAIAAEKSATSVSACTTVKGKHVFDLDSAGTYYLKLGPSAAAAKVTVVLEQS